MKVREAIEALLRQDMDADLVVGVRLTKPSAGEIYDPDKETLWVPLGDVTVKNNGRCTVVLDCPISLTMRTEVELNDSV